MPGRLAYWMRALGRHDLPDRLEVSGRTLRRLETAKHGFWAATGFYEDESGGRAVLKVYRIAPFAGAPLRWLGRWQCGREVGFYRYLTGLACVPPLLARVGDTAYLRAFVAGRCRARALSPTPSGRGSTPRCARCTAAAWPTSTRTSRERPGRRRRLPVPDRFPDRLPVRAERRSRARPLVARAAAARGPVPRARAQAALRPRVDDVLRADERSPAERPDPPAPPAQPPLPHGAPPAVPMAPADRPRTLVGSS